LDFVSCVGTTFREKEAEVRDICLGRKQGWAILSLPGGNEGSRIARFGLKQVYVNLNDKQWQHQRSQER
jgi:hypothetical protein